MTKEMIENVAKHIREFQSQVARCPGMFAGKRRNRRFVMEAEKVAAFCGFWRDKREVHGVGRPPALHETNHGLQLRTCDMNEQHQRWFMKKFGHPDPNVMTISDMQGA